PAPRGRGDGGRQAPLVSRPLAPGQAGGGGGRRWSALGAEGDGGGAVPPGGAPPPGSAWTGTAGRQPAGAHHAAEGGRLVGDADGRQAAVLDWSRQPPGGGRPCGDAGRRGPAHISEVSM